jgi:ABC-type multidrug transport system ATPase subunit
MRIKVIPHGGRLPKDAKSVVFLLTDGWDDWFKFNTMYNVFYCDEEGEQHRIGDVKIGEFGMAKGQRRPNIPEEFESLDDAFFSLGQDDSYYEELNGLGDVIRDEFLTAMRDVAQNAELFERALKEDVTGVSLLRFVSDQAVRGQFRRMAQGGARLTPFSFTYTPPPWGRTSRPPTFKFEVVPEAKPPTNVHVLIGRNGVGKTHTVNQMTNALVRPEDGSYGLFAWNDADEVDEPETFPNIISVTFSAFDPFEPLPIRENKLSSVRYQYVGLKHVGKDEDGNPKPPKSPDDLATEFGQSVQVIVTQVAKRERWRRALTLLESDRIFKRAEVWKLIDEHQVLLETLKHREALKELRKQARDLYGKLSSGHKIVLLTITGVVETLEERSLVLVDEPEAHLHPPLLSAFIRSLSDLLINRNGVAIIATHSPVILQEVPRTCVWRIRRIGREAKIERPLKETFGENVGTLTHAIFGLEVTDSGFHKMISEAVDEGLSYEDIVERFGDQLGDEARGIARSLIATRSGQD